jgi:hypothetical protein
MLGLLTGEHLMPSTKLCHDILNQLKETPSGTYNCRHMPHGDAGGEMSVDTARARKVRIPEVYLDSAIS